LSHALCAHAHLCLSSPLRCPPPPRRPRCPYTTLFRSPMRGRCAKCSRASRSCSRATREPRAPEAPPKRVGLLRTRCAWLPRSSRSEEHTSELQSHLNLVCRLLLEKKKRDDSDVDAQGE